jgi:hypothetical protein
MGAGSSLLSNKSVFVSYNVNCTKEYVQMYIDKIGIYGATVINKFNENIENNDISFIKNQIECADIVVSLIDSNTVKSYEQQIVLNEIIDKNNIKKIYLILDINSAPLRNNAINYLIGNNDYYLYFDDITRDKTLSRIERMIK